MINLEDPQRQKLVISGHLLGVIVRLDSGQDVRQPTQLARSLNDRGLISLGEQGPHDCDLEPQN